MPRDRRKDEISSSGCSACSVTAALNWRTRWRAAGGCWWRCVDVERAGRDGADATFFGNGVPQGGVVAGKRVCAGFRRNAAAGLVAGINANNTQRQRECRCMRMRATP